MISKELLEILVCPETHDSLSLADEPLIARLNQAIDTRRLKNRAGQAIEQKLQGGLVRSDRAMLYPIIDDIPVMLVDQAIPLAQLDIPGS